MMENYERTMELVETAQNSAGRGQEQFAKSQDTLQAKLNTLSNTWEQFRLEFFNQTFFKDIVDLANKLLGTISNFDIEQIASLGIIGITLGKLIITQLIDQIRQGSGAIQTAWNKAITTPIAERFKGGLKEAMRSSLQEAGTAFTDGVTRNAQREASFNQLIGQGNEGFLSGPRQAVTSTNVGQTLTDLSSKVTSYRQIREELTQIQTGQRQLNNLSQEDVLNLQEKVRVQKQEIENLLKTLGYERDISAEDVRQLEATLNQAEVESRGGLKGKLQRFKGSAVGQGISAGAQTGLSTGLTTALTMAVSGADIGTIVKTSLTTALMGAIPSIINVIIPPVLAILTGPAGVLAAVLAVGGAALIGLSKIESEQKKAEEAEERRLRTVMETNDEIARQQEKLLGDYQNKVKESEDLTEKVGRLNELQSKSFLNANEEEELKTLAAELNESYPEIVSSYDEATGALELNTSALEELKETMQEEIAEMRQRTQVNDVTRIANLENASKGSEKNKTDLTTQLNSLIYQGRAEEIGTSEKDLVQDINKDYNGVYLETLDESVKTTLMSVFADTLQSLSQEEALKAGISETVYDAALTDNLDGFTEKLEESGMNLNTFANSLVEATESQVKTIENETKIAKQQALQNSYATSGIEGMTDDIARALSKVDTGKNIGELADEAIQDYFNEINNETFDGGRIDANKDFIDKIKDFSFENVGKNISYGELEDVWEFLGYGKTKNEEKQLKGIAELFDGNTTNLTDFGNLSSTLKDIVTNLGITEEEWSNRRDEAEWSAQTLQKIMAYTKMASSSLYEQWGLDDEQLTKLMPQLTEYSTLLTDMSTMTLTDAQEKIEDFTKTFKADLEGAGVDTSTVDSIIKSLNQDAQDTILTTWQDTQDELKEIVDSSEVIQNKGAINDYLDSLDQVTLTALSNTIKNLNMTDLEKDKFLQTAQSQLSDLKSGTQNILLSLDMKKTREELMKEADMTIQSIADAEEVTYEQASDIYKDYVSDMTSLFYKGVFGKEGALGLQASINETFSSFDTNYEKLFKAQEEYYKDGKLSAETYYDLLNSEFSKYVDITKNGYDFLAESAEKAYASAAKEPVEQLKQAIEDNKKLEQEIQNIFIDKDNEKINKAISNLKMGISGPSDTPWDAKEWDVIQKIAKTQYETIEEYQKAMHEGTLSQESLLSDTQIQSLEVLSRHYQDLSENVVNLEEDLSGLNDELTDLQDELVDLQDELADLNDELLENQQAIDDAYKTWQEAIHGTDDYQSSIDGLINYNNLLSETERKLNNIKDNLEDIQTINEGSDSLRQFKQTTEQQLGQLGAEKMVVQGAMDNVYNTLMENYGNYTQFDQNGMLSFDFSIEDADMPDALKDNYQTLIEKYNELYNQRNEITDKEEDANQAFLDMQSEFVDARVSMEEKVIDILKEKMQEEVDQVNEKYEAIEEADNNYIDALEEAINKQRELREQENKYEDLAQKQKKLSLMQRDTSGANQKEVQNLEKELQNDRQQLLDDEVDNLIDSLKELYEKQAEARELEIEAMELTIEDMSLLNSMAQEIIGGFQNSDDIVAWFVANNPEVTNMSTAQTEQYINDIREESSQFLLSIAAQTEELTLNAETVAAITQDTFNSVAEGITDVGTVAQEQAEATAQEAIDNAKEAYDNAVQTMNDTQAKIEETGQKIADTNTKINETNQLILDKEDEIAKARVQQSEAFKTTMDEMVSSAKSSMSEVAYFATKFLLDTAKNEVDFSDPAQLDQFLTDKGLKDGNEEVSLGTYNAIKDSGYNTDGLRVRERAWYEIVYTPNAPGAPSQVIDHADTIEKAEEKKDNEEKFGKRMEGSYTIRRQNTRYAKGGLVDFTGPAWVDGTPNKPEAFLSSEDTQRIGEAAKILASLPALQSSSSTSNISTTNVGDTSIEIHINVAELKNDYDVDQMIERVKQDIVDVSNSVGTSVILKK